MVIIKISAFFQRRVSAPKFLFGSISLPKSISIILFPAYYTILFLNKKKNVVPIPHNKEDGIDANFTTLFVITNGLNSDYSGIAGLLKK